MTPEQRQLMSTPGANTSTLPLPPTGEALVTVVDSDVDNVLVTIVRDLALSGSVAVEGRSASPSDLAAIKVELRALLAGRLSPPNMGTFSMTPDGTFTYKNLRPSEFLLTMASLPPDLYIKEARIGNLDVLGQIFPLTNQPTATLKIVLAKGSEVRGTVNDAASKSIANQQVVLVPERTPIRPDLYKTATTDASGRFTIQGVAPGEYKAYAWQTLEPFRYFDVGFMRQFEDRGSAVHAVEGFAASANVPLIP